MLWIEGVSLDVNGAMYVFMKRVFEELDILPLFGPETSNL